MIIRRLILIGFTLAMCLLALGYIKREPLFLNYLKSKTPTVELDDLEKMLEPNIHISMPTAEDDKLPAVLLFHGCAGYRPTFMAHWAKVVTDAGYVAVVVDSHTARGIGREQALKTVCNGEELIGQERAGDVLAAYNLVKKRNDIDPAQIYLAGWSHGAWSVMDFLTMNMANKHPAQLSKNVYEKPAVAGVILFYPYCGMGAHSRFDKWQQNPPTIAFVAGADSIVNPAECLSVFKRLSKSGQNIDLNYYPEAEHIFDDPSTFENSDYWYSKKYAPQAIAEVSAFLKKQAATP